MKLHDLKPAPGSHTFCAFVVPPTRSSTTCDPE